LHLFRDKVHVTKMKLK